MRNSEMTVICTLMAASIGAGCAQVASHHAVQRAELGVPSASRALEDVIDSPGPVQVETVLAAHWEVTRAGLINLDDPRAKAAGLEEGPEPIEVYFQEWSYQSDADGRFAGVIDVFGDGSVWALHVPGQTPGSTAFVARTPSGPVAFLGDACHTRFGWEHRVEPGTFSADLPASRMSLIALAELAERHPALDVRLGHQARGVPVRAADAAH